MALGAFLGGLIIHPVLLAYLPIAALVIGTLFCVSRAILDPLRSIPGPKLARFTRFWYLKHANKGKQHWDETDLHKNYGPVVRLAPNQYSFTDLPAAKVIYDHGSKFPKSDFYNPFGVPSAAHANLFQDQNIDSHSLKRRRVASLFSMTSIVSYEPMVDDCIQTYLDQLDKFANESNIIELPAWMQYYAFDVIGAITLGEPFGFLTHGNDFPGIIGEMRRSQTFATHLGSFAGSWYPYIVAVLSRIVKKPPFEATQKYTEASLAKKHRELEDGKTTLEITGRRDFAEKLLKLKAENKITDNDIVSCVRGNIAAGSDTTGISLSAIIYQLIHHPSALNKLREEIEEYKRNQPEGQSSIPYSDAQLLPYLDATIKEALRLHPALGMQLPRVVPEGGATLAGHYFPAGTVVGVNAWSIHRQPEIFGTDAEQFRPERWLQNEQTTKVMEKGLFTFGAGARTCLGRNVSMLEMLKLVPELVTRYDFELAGKTREMDTLNRLFVYTSYECLVRRRTDEGKN